MVAAGKETLQPLPQIDFAPSDTQLKCDILAAMPMRRQMIVATFVQASSLDAAKMCVDERHRGDPLHGPRLDTERHVQRDMLSRRVVDR